MGGLIFAELPGFYYDAGKNRYFPYKGPIPGSSSKPPSVTPLSEKHKQVDSMYEYIRMRNSKLLQVRELCGNVISSSKGKLSFQAEYRKRHASQPLIWTYKGTNKMGNVALEHAIVDVISPCGLMKRDILLTGGVNGLLWVPGSVYLLDLSKPLDFDVGVPIAGDGLYELAAFKQTLWTIDCDPEGMRAVIGKFLGTNRGAALLNMETGASSWVFRCKSDVLSLQLNLSGNFILCGLRNGAIVTVDTREKQVNLCRSTGTLIAPLQYQCNHLSAGGEDCYLRLWDIKSGELLFKNRFMNSIPSAVCWPRVRDSENYRCYWQEHYFGTWIGSYEGIYYMDWL
ncbi:hypothetical protein F511_16353 [Dorcoceras hygrometricum]|uniref:Uncharacterized protein n=1 Tax=Dorcoceras hygrometricum TaxID=472368 RepID=A0A2Z7AQM2_9LAMI|nr:hypothetical protein F511_16353 [Dorcoceras hygrometricum]